MATLSLTFGTASDNPVTGGQRWKYFLSELRTQVVRGLQLLDHNNARMSTVQVSSAFSLVGNKHAMVNMHAVERVKIS